MARRGTPTFIVERALVVSVRDERELLVRLDLARQLFNACLGEALRRLDLMRESLDCARARAMLKTAGKKPNKKRAAAFAALRHRYGFTSDALSAFGTRCKNEAKWNEGRSRTDPRLGAHECQRIAERAFSAGEVKHLHCARRSGLHGVADLLKAADEATGGLGGISKVEVGCAEVVPLGAVAQHVPGGGEHRGGRPRR